MTTLTLPKSRNDIVADIEGDLILVLPKSTRVRCSSLLLSLASPVIGAMLRSGFSEGQAARSATQPQEIAFPDDEPFAMAMICCLLHYHHPEFCFKDLSVGVDEAVFVLSYAVLVDKYDCAEALFSHSYLFFNTIATRKLSNPLGPIQLSRLIKAAYYTKSPKYFTLFTYRLILTYCGPFTDLQGDNETEDLPIEVLFSLEQQRTMARNDILTLMATLTPFDTNWSFSTARSSKKDSLLELTGTAKWPPNWKITSLQTIITKLRAAHEPISVWSVDLDSRSYATAKDHTIPFSDLQSLGRKAAEYPKGLCLPCARQNKLRSTCAHESTMRAWLAEEIGPY